MIYRPREVKHLSHATQLIELWPGFGVGELLA